MIRNLNSFGFETVKGYMDFCRPRWTAGPVSYALFYQTCPWDNGINKLRFGR